MEQPSPLLSFEDIRELLMPLLDVRCCKQVNVTNLRREHRELLVELRESNLPMVLKVADSAFLVSDARTFCELEQRRRKLAESCGGVENAVRLGKRFPPLARDLAILQGELRFLKTRMDEDRRSLHTAEQKYAELEAKRDLLEEKIKSSGNR